MNVMRTELQIQVQKSNMKTDGEEQTFTPTGTTKRLAPRRPSVDATSASIVFVGIVFAEIVSLRLFRFVFLAIR